MWRRAIAALLVAGALVAVWRVTQPAHTQRWQLQPVTFDAGLTGWPAISQDGKTIVYASDRDGGKNLDLYVQPVQGAPRRLTETPEDESEPAISPDGKWVVYHSTRHGGGIYAIPMAGGEGKLVMPHAGTPRYSPDGHSLSFRNQAGVFIFPEGQKQRQVLPAMALTGGGVWSPDGHFLLVETTEGIWLAPVQGGAPTLTSISQKLAEAGLPRSLPADATWTSGGLVFSARRGATRDVYLLRLDRNAKARGAVTAITNGTEPVRDVAAASGRVVFASGPQRFDIWGIPIDPATGLAKGEPYRITNSMAPTASPAVSNDGKRLLYNSSLHGFAEVWMKDLPGGAERVVASGPGGASGGKFLRKSGRIAYVRDDGLYVVDPASGEFRKVAGSVRALWDVDRAEQVALVDAPGGADVLDLATGHRSPLLRAPEHGRVWGLEFSADDKWIILASTNGSSVNRIFAVPAHWSEAIPYSDWRPLTDGAEKVDKPQFGPDSRRVYFTVERDGVREIQAINFDLGTGNPTGPPYEVWAGGTPRLSLASINSTALQIGVSREQIITILGESLANIWIADPVPNE